MRRLLLAVSAASVLACGGGPSEESPSAPEPAAPVEAAAPAAMSPADAWKRDHGAFVAAASAGDYAALTPMAVFPFQTRGPMDEDPVVHWEASDFPVLMKHYLASSSGYDVEQTELDDHKGQRGFQADDVASGTLRVGDLVFTYVDGAWKASFCYIDLDVQEAAQNEIGG